MKQINILLFLILSFGFSSAQESITGFTTENAKKQQALEKAFEAKLTPENLDQWMQRMAAEPHWVGTEYGMDSKAIQVMGLRCENRNLPCLVSLSKNTFA